MASGRGSSVSICLVLAHVLLLLLVDGAAGLRVGFHRKRCPKAESIVKHITWARAAVDPSLAAKMLRLYFHDCFPQGCDASVLLDGPATEKMAGPNESLGGLDVVDEAKAAVELACPGTVSCADVLALATRDAVSFQFRRPLWRVETGRRDSRTSFFRDGFKVPNLESGFPELKRNFSERDLSVADLVALSGAHTLGRINCTFVSPRLFPDNGGGPDPLIDRRYAQELMRQCPNRASTGTVALDPRSEFDFDTSYYAAVKANRGVIRTDAALLQDEEAARLVDEMHDQGKFLAAFAASINKMGAFQVLTGKNGEIRRNCRVVN